MSYGLQTWQADGTPHLIMDGAGGVFIGTINHDPNIPDPTVYVFPNLGGLSLRVVQSGANKNYWHIGTSGGHPAVFIDEYTSTTHYDYGGTLFLWVFGV